MNSEQNTLEMPELYDSNLDEATLERLFEDIRLCTDVVGISLKSRSQAYAARRKVSLHDALQLLRLGEVRGVQIRYNYQGQEWWDTVMSFGNGYRIVRTSPLYPDHNMEVIY